LTKTKQSAIIKSSKGKRKKNFLAHEREVNFMRDNRMTQRAMYAAIITWVQGEAPVIPVEGDEDDISITAEDIIEFCKERTDKLDKKSSGTSKAVLAAKQANEDLKERIYEAIASSEAPVTASMLVEWGIVPSTQKATPQLRNLVTEGRITNYKEKKTSYYKVA
jgi:hypothetical protein